MDKKLIVIVLAATIVLMAGGVLVINLTNTPQITASQNAKAYVSDPTSHDLGKVDYAGGVVKKSFTIKNTGNDALKVYNIKTSCHCTKAYVTIGGQDSPNFGMDSVSSWMGEVGNGKEAKITVVYDPAFHGPAGIGPFTRFASVETNDKSNPKLIFTLSGTVIK